MTEQRKRYSADFKAKVALEALRGELTAAQLASKHGIHQTMVGSGRGRRWKAGGGVFRPFGGAGTASLQAELRSCTRIGQLLVEQDFGESGWSMVSSEGGG